MNNTTRSNKAPAPNHRPRFPIGGARECEYHVGASPPSTAAVGEAQRYELTRAKKFAAMKTGIFFCCILLSASAKAEDVSLTINGVTNDVTLGKESVITLADGATLKVLVASKPYAIYSDKLCSFEHPAEHKPEISKDKHGDTTITFISASGPSVIIHEHGMSTESLVDMLLKEVTKNDIAKGFSSVERKIVKSVSGGTFSGKEITTANNKKENIHRVLECRSKDVDIVITVFFSRDDAAQAEKFLEHFWSTMKIKKEPGPQGADNGSQPARSTAKPAPAAAGSRRSP